MKCIIENCKEKAKYNYKNYFNPAYCNIHCNKDMKNFESYSIKKIFYNLLKK